ncbi:uncharacterized protein UV8b_04766 [Ustilaginoidea virens]|uniref:C2H2-type domain-containing protein n=1 Tax=Ustilaginoidea virens TaxID=1159556 RepID=A0A8E5HRX1_USTVR|nr:uncharacterized protein UV8b_04766 [Ustilaginoidea virens]QUC20525.1 hypothetical protein UV8b_04766 [Ustilaginoidea virens]
MPPDVKASLRLIRPSVRQLKKEAAKAAVQKYQEVPLNERWEILKRKSNGANAHEEIAEIHEAVETSKGAARCLFGCGTFFNTSALARHVRKLHMHIFKTRFVCPEWKRMKREEAVIEANPGAWSSHVRRVHCKVYAPNLESLPDALCLLRGQ